MSESNLSIGMLLKATLLGAGLFGIACVHGAYAQEVAPQVADASDTPDGAEPASPEDPGGLFVNPDSDEAPPPGVQIDPEIPELDLQAITEIMPDGTGSQYRVRVEQPAMLTLLLDGPQTARVSVRDPSGRQLLNQSEIIGNGRFQQNIRLDGLQAPDATIIHTPMYPLAEPGDYLVEVRLPVGSETPAYLGASIVLYPEGVNGDAGAQEEPARPIDTPPEQTPVLPAAAWQVAEISRETSILWYKIEPEQVGLHTVAVRATGQEDIYLTLYQDGQFVDAVLSVDDDPFNQQGSESLVFSAAQGQTYYLKIYNRRDNGGGVSVYLLPLPEELPEAQPRDPDAEAVEPEDVDGHVPEAEPEAPASGPDAAAADPPAAEPVRPQ